MIAAPTKRRLRLRTDAPSGPAWPTALPGSPKSRQRRQPQPPVLERILSFYG